MNKTAWHPMIEAATHPMNETANPKWAASIKTKNYGETRGPWPWSPGPKTPMNKTAKESMNETAEKSNEWDSKCPMSKWYQKERALWAPMPCGPGPKIPMNETTKTQMNETAKNPMNETTTNPMDETAPNPMNETANSKWAAGINKKNYARLGPWPWGLGPKLPMNETAKHPMNETAKNQMDETATPQWADGIERKEPYGPHGPWAQGPKIQWLRQQNSNEWDNQKSNEWDSNKSNDWDSNASIELGSKSLMSSWYLKKAVWARGPWPLGPRPKNQMNETANKSCMKMWKIKWMRQQKIQWMGQQIPNERKMLKQVGLFWPLGRWPLALSNSSREGALLTEPFWRSPYEGGLIKEVLWERPYEGALMRETLMRSPLNNLLMGGVAPPPPGPSRLFVHFVCILICELRNTRGSSILMESGHTGREPPGTSNGKESVQPSHGNSYGLGKLVAFTVVLRFGVSAANP